MSNPMKSTHASAVLEGVWLTYIPCVLSTLLEVTLGDNLTFPRQAADVEVELTDTPRTKPHLDNLKFGHEFSDHMFEVDWTEVDGWAKPKIIPIQYLRIHPAAKVLHYATEVRLFRYYCTITLYIYIERERVRAGFRQVEALRPRFRGPVQ